MRVILQEHLCHVVGKIIMHPHFLFHHFRKVCFLLVRLKHIYKLSLSLTPSPITDEGHRHYPGTGGALDWISHFTACVCLWDKHTVVSFWKDVLLSSFCMLLGAFHLLTFACDIYVQKPICCTRAQSHTTDVSETSINYFNEHRIRPLWLYEEPIIGFFYEPTLKPPYKCNLQGVDQRKHCFSDSVEIWLRY